jgi:hypothetical protein
MSQTFSYGMCGAPSNTYQVTQEIIDIANRFRPHLEEHHGCELEQFEVCSYTSQVVAGLIYRIKVQIADEVAYQLNIYKDLNGNFSLNGIEQAECEVICG